MRKLLRKAKGIKEYKAFFLHCLCSNDDDKWYFFKFLGTFFMLFRPLGSEFKVKS